MKRTRAELAGRMLAQAIIEMVHLMYQENTAKKFLVSVINALTAELNRRTKAFKEVGIDL